VSYALELKCLKCGASYPLQSMFEGCPKCRTDKMVSNLEINYDYDRVGNMLDKDTLQKRSKERGVWKYEELLPVKVAQHMFTLGEGNTPLVKCERLGRKVGIRNLYIKDETRNPTWSFKDRHSCTAIAKGLEFGAKVVTVSSYTNMAGSTAAYAARVGLSCVVFVPSFVPENMLTWLQVYGAKVVPVTTSEGRWALESRCVRELGWYPVGTYTSPMATYNPYGVEGLKTIGYEICEQLGWRAPNKIFSPTAYGGNIWATWKAFQEFEKMGLVEGKPAMISVEPEVLGPIANAISKGLDYVEPVPWKNSSALSIAGTTSSYQALKTVRESGGSAVKASDEALVEMQKLLASLEGIYGEVASMASIVGAKVLREKGEIQEDETVVCIVTSTGLKALETTRKSMPGLFSAIEPNWSMFANLMKQRYGMTV